MQNTIVIRATLKLKIKNIADDCNLKDIKPNENQKLIEKNNLDIIFDSRVKNDSYNVKIELRLGNGTSAKRLLSSAYTASLNSKEVYKQVDRTFSSFLLDFFYSYDVTSSSDIYQLQTKKDSATFSLISNTANPANSC
ncbi:hypothetical protein ES754_01965 [Psychrobacter frigidicola]|uniref:Uncharacterized protein n=1 Tax=Psychrobacter frigidicola TaxID=45611 RepID=A0A5C7A5F7_9GAMM|nr:hypothetical protein [Psychrobacter frigidicola]TXD97764.1 hypothetical protein ES754_01965 [Psychrobacter frigidicola]